jgi:hypothetical protein
VGDGHAIQHRKQAPERGGDSFQVGIGGVHVEEVGADPFLLEVGLQLGNVLEARPAIQVDAEDPISGFGQRSDAGFAEAAGRAQHQSPAALADLILERTSELTVLPWVGDLPRRWEPEPLRWLGASTMRWLAERADRSEFRRGRPSRVYGSLFRALAG